MNTRIFNYGKDKFYFIHENKLIAGIPNRTIIEANNVCHYFDTPLGEVSLHDDAKLFLSPKHFLDFKTDNNVSSVEVENVCVNDLWRKAGYTTNEFRCLRLTMYYIYDGQIGTGYNTIHAIILDKDGVHLHPKFTEGVNFKSKKEAIDFLAKNMEVVDFDGTTTGLGVERKIEEKTIDVKLKVFEEK